MKIKQLMVWCLVVGIIVIPIAQANIFTDIFTSFVNIFSQKEELDCFSTGKILSKSKVGERIEVWADEEFEYQQKVDNKLCEDYMNYRFDNSLVCHKIQFVAVNKTYHVPLYNITYEQFCVVKK